MGGPFSTHHKYAPGLGDKINGQIDSILQGWKKAGVAQMNEKKKDKKNG